ncbi:MAG: hypothetical protein R3Y47_02880 [Lachnospiraceae bacterium]
MKNFIKRINIHLIFFATILLIILIAVLRIVKWNNSGTLVTTENEYAHLFDVETLDSYVPYVPADDYVEDGITNIAFFGNAPFANDMGTPENLAEMIGVAADANVYNFSFADSYCAAESAVLSYDNKDILSSYWLTTIFTLENDIIVDNMYASDLTLTAEEQATLSSLQNMDFNNIDIITIMYDASDYYAVHGMYNRDDSTNITHFVGALEASISLIKEAYPHIQIIVLSPTYAYALDDDGNYIDSIITRYGEEGPLCDYIHYQSESVYKMLCSYVDNFYGSVNVNNADDYLEDHITLNQTGKELVTARFMEAFDYYTYYKEKYLAE